MRIFGILLTLAAVATGTASAEGGFGLAASLQSPAPVIEGWFGNSIALAGAQLIVGEAFGDAGSTRRAGRAHLFAVTGEILLSLQSPSPRKEGNFGGEEYCNKLVAVGPGACGVGETRAQGGGKTYLFGHDGSLAATLKSAEPLRGNSKEFGNSLAMDGDRLLVGSYNAGAYLYDSTGTLLASFKGSRGGTQDGFGMATAIRGGTIVVTQDHATVGGVRDAGMAYLFDASGTLIRELRPPDPVQPALYGVSAATSGDLVVIGAPEATVDGRTRAGLAFLYTSAGELVAVLSAPVPAMYFGVSVAVDDRRIVVGASGAKVGGLNGAGLAFVFDREGTFKETLQPPKPSTGGMFGWSVASEEDFIAVSAPGEEAGVKRAAGKVYLFKSAGP